MEIFERIERVLNHGQYILGPEVFELEQKLGERVGRYCVTCGSGTDGLLLSLMLHGIGPGDRVIVPAFSFIATSEVVSFLGAEPVFVDIDPRTFNINLDRYDAKGIIAVDLFGLPADFDRINSIAKEHGLFVIEDACQGFGGVYKGRPACSLGDLGVTSFFPSKPLGCYGDGGAIFTDSKEVAERLISLREHGRGKHKYITERIGMNSRLDTIQAAVLLGKLETFDSELKGRKKKAAEYNNPDVITPYIPDGYESAWAQYSVLAKDEEHRNSLNGRVYYPIPLPMQPVYNKNPADFPIANDIAKRIISLPLCR